MLPDKIACEKTGYKNEYSNFLDYLPSFASLIHDAVIIHAKNIRVNGDFQIEKLTLTSMDCSLKRKRLRLSLRNLQAILFDMGKMV